MKIVFINETCGIGSIGNLTLDLMRGLDKKGVKCFCLYSKKTRTNCNTYKICSTFETKLHALLSRIFGLQGYFSFFSTFRMQLKLDEIKPDIVVLENLHANFINLKKIFSYFKRKKIPIVLVLHDCWYYTGKCTYYVAANCYRWQKECGNCPLLYKDNVNPTFFFDRTKKCLKDKKELISSLSNVSVVGVSSWVTNESKKSFLNKYNPKVIYNWVDQDIFKRKDPSELIKKLHLENKRIVLMVSSRISSIKGYEEFLYISERINRNLFQVIIVGKNKDCLYIPEWVIHIPYTENLEELSLLYNIADVCVNTTKYETFGMVTAESLSCGTPVVVYDNTASKELVNEKCGIVVKNNDLSGVLNAVYTICKVGKDYYSDNCIDFAKRMFDKARAISEYLDLFVNMLNKQSIDE